jgi:uncharacterized RDD family membrane protein YckC
MNNEENRYAPPQAEVGEVQDTAPELASLGLRLGGAVIDTLILAVVVVPLVFVFGIIDISAQREPSFADEAISTVLGMGVFVLINGHFLAKHGQTIGKRLVGTRIVSVADGKLLPLQKLIALRYLPMWLLSLVPFIGNIANLVNILFIFRDDRRCVHDLIAGTKVVKA